MARFFVLLFSILSLIIYPAIAQKSAPVPPSAPRPYADVADLATAAPITAEVRIRKATKITVPPPVGGFSPYQRFLIEADVTALIRGNNALPPRINFLFDAPRDIKGKLPKLVKSAVIIFAAPVANRPQQIQLIAPDAMIPASADDIIRVRRILLDLTRADAPPRITGVGNAFHVAGTLSDEGETQIFLNSDDGRPLSFNIVRRAGAPSTWSISIGEIVDATAPTPARDTFVWYRLACFLPRTLPAGSISASSPQETQIIEDDYRTVIKGLGVCQRSRITSP